MKRIMSNYGVYVSKKKIFQFHNPFNFYKIKATVIGKLQYTKIIPNYHINKKKLNFYLIERIMIN